MSSYSKGFDFDATEISRNIAVLDERIGGFLEETTELHKVQGVAAMKAKAPWRDRTGAARRGLWAEGEVVDKNIHLEMGHTEEYGVYLEENNQKRFAIVEPTLAATGRSIMRSLERMFLQLQAHTPPSAAIVPDGATKPNTTVSDYEHRDRRGQVSYRDKGRFISKDTAKKLARNAASRARYAAKKAAGTLPTRRTKKG